MNKIKNYIASKILKEISEYPIDNWHGINSENIKDHLIPPLLHTYYDPMDENTNFQYWTVLEELPEEKTAYTIFYDPEGKEFGLGMHGESGKMFSLGIYGSFIEALNAM